MQMVTYSTILFIFMPNQREENLPVMVFIHGGGFVALEAANFAPYVLMNRYIVLVIIQYRLGILDFCRRKIQ
ncbi:Pyrethroid hydrolase Ces2a [Armadillidium vulgare]|nr:Pyrethroid hydrolase Ces2a [Armadillidium vulgare]